MSKQLDPRTASVDDLEELYQKHGHGLPERVMEEDTAPLKTIEAAPQALQFRDASVEPWKKERHIERLVNALEKQDQLFDALLLFPINGFRLVLDGHCRLEAYEKAGLGADTRVPVDYFSGDFSAALMQPAAENSKDKLPLSPEEKWEAAWQLVVYDETRGNYSHRDIARVSGASKSLVGNMRNVLREDDRFGFDPRQRTWKEVKRGKRKERDTDDDWQMKRIKRWARDVRKKLGGKPNETPDCLFRALEKAYPQVFPDGIPRRWAEEAGVLQEIRGEKEESISFSF